MTMQKHSFLKQDDIYISALTNSIKIRCDVGNIKVIHNKHLDVFAKIEYYLRDSDKANFSIVDGVGIFEVIHEKGTVNCNDELFDEKKLDIALTLNDSAFKSLSLYTKVGSIAVDGGIRVCTLQATALSGNIGISNCDLTELQLKSNDGDIQLKDVLAKIITISQKLGDCIGTKINCEMLDVKVIDGSISFCNSFLGKVQAVSISGDINLELQPDFDVNKSKIKTLEGKIKLNGRYM